jgi:3-isopropylmalate/(R)-2-methylmalate dehydratase large subunit
VGALPIDRAWIGSCVGGRHADLRHAAELLRGRRVRVPLAVTPATRAIYEACLADGTLATLVAAGATVLPPGCGACAGVHGGVLAAGERMVATATRNFRGRMGSPEGEIYLGSAFTVAAAAVAGRIIDPRELT